MLIAVAVVLALALLAVGNFARFIVENVRDPYSVALRIEQMRGAAGAVPAGAAVAYMSDAPLNDPASEAIFDIARYALAPRPLLTGPEAGRAEWVLGCFLQPYESGGFAAQNGLTVAADYRNGVVLFRRAK